MPGNNRSLEYGEDWQKRLHDAIRQCDRVMLFWTAATSASEWVRREWQYALSVGKTVVPTLLDFTPLPEPLAKLHAVTALRAQTGIAAAIRSPWLWTAVGATALAAGWAWLALTSVRYVTASTSMPEIVLPPHGASGPHPLPPSADDGGLTDVPGHGHGAPLDASGTGCVVARRGGHRAQVEATTPR